MKTNNPKVIHYSTIPTAGAPLHIVKCLQKYSKLDVRLIQKRSSYSDGRKFPEDLILNEETEQMIRGAEILHVHNMLPLEMSSFLNKRLFGTLHSTPKSYNWHELMKRTEKCFTIRQPMQMIDYDGQIGSLPTIIDIYELIPVKRQWDKIIINFAPTNKCTPPRPQSKGYTEVTRVLERIRDEFPKTVELQVYGDKHHMDDLNTKKYAHIIIDDVVRHDIEGRHRDVGTFHLTGLFGLSYGCCVLNAIKDEEMVDYYKKGFGAVPKDFYNPFEYCKYQTLRDTLRKLITNRDYLKQKMIMGRLWMEKFYNPKVLVKEYEEIYK